MKINTSIPGKLKLFFEKELRDSRICFDRKDFPGAWHHLERAHIIGQRYPWHHTLVHWKMLVFGFRIKDSREILGQIPRLLVGGVKSFVGKIPVGNTGGANVPPMQAMEIQEDLMKILSDK